MAGSRIPLDAATLITATRTASLERTGATVAGAFFVAVTAITRTTGTLTISLYWSTDGTVANGLKVAEVAGLTATGVANITLQAPFTTANVAVPIPNVAVWTLVGDTTNVTGTITGLLSN